MILREKKRNELGIPLDAMWLLNVGELITRKNQEILIHAVSYIPDAYLTIVGQGELKEHLTEVIRNAGVEGRVKLLGFRTDINQLCQAADVFVFPSFQEGLSVALMEAMACGLPCVVSNIRGNNDLVDWTGGELFDPMNMEDCREAISSVLCSPLNKMGRLNSVKIRQFDADHVITEIRSIYMSVE